MSRERVRHPVHVEFDALIKENHLWSRDELPSRISQLRTLTDRMITPGDRPNLVRLLEQRL